MLYKTNVKLHRHFGKIAEILDCKKEDVVLYHRNLESYHSSIPHKDILVSTTPLYPLKEVKYRRRGKYNHYQSGINLFKTRIGNVPYVVVNLPNRTGNNIQFVCLDKNNIFAWERNVRRQTAAYQKSLATLPILDEKFIQSILHNTLEFFAHKKKLIQYGAKIKRGIVLAGLPGNGKTMLCKYISSIASSKGIQSMNINAGHIEKAFAEDSLSQLMNRHGFIFIDDVDIAYFCRTGPKASIACSLLSAMDGLDSDSHTVRIFTTNEDIENIDDAFLRPGRIDKFFTFTKPTADMRKRFINTWHKDIVSYINKVNALDIVVNHTEGMSFAELDLIRTCLAEEFIQDGKWDIDKAIKTTKRRLENKQENERRLVGFGLAARAEEEEDIVVQEGLDLDSL